MLVDTTRTVTIALVALKSLSLSSTLAAAYGRSLHHHNRHSFLSFNRFRRHWWKREGGRSLFVRMGNSQSISNVDLPVDSTADASGLLLNSSSADVSSPAAAVVTMMTKSDCSKKKNQVQTTTPSFDCATLYQQHKSYSPPSSNITPSVHYIFLVHGWLGNDLEMSYLAEAFGKAIAEVHDDVITSDDDEQGPIASIKRAKRSSSRISTTLLQESKNYNNNMISSSSSSSSTTNNNNDRRIKSTEQEKEEKYHPEIIVHSVKCNVGKTHDGIRNGGTRLANEIINFIQSDTQKRRGEKDDVDDGTDVVRDVTFSLIGNSLGGLYSRFAISLIPYWLEERDNNTKIRMYPNVFCTTATPHLGVSQHTYLPIPRLAETIIGTGMGVTGRDLFRLNSDIGKNNMSGATATAAVVAATATAAKTVKKLSSFAMRRVSNGNNEEEEEGGEEEEDGGELECIIRNMCLQDEYLLPLRNFRHRIAYANAYGTDFQVPCQTAAFLNDNSGVGHFIVAARCSSNVNDAVAEKKSDDAERRKRNNDEEEGEAKKSVLPPFVVAVLRTEEQSQPQSPSLKSSEQNTASDELLQMSQSLDALGWTKVFIDVRDSIPVPGLRKPAWMCRNSLDDLIKQREEEDVHNSEEEGNDIADAKVKDGTNANRILTSQDLSRSTAAADSINIPLGHTVMVANSKSETYKQINFQGRPVMDKLAHDVVDDVLAFV